MTNKIEVNYCDVLIVDPCYIKNVSTKSGETRFDALKLERVLHELGDGEIAIVEDGFARAFLSCDSGRIWALRAEFDCEVELDCSECDYMVRKAPFGREIENLETYMENEDD